METHLDIYTVSIIRQMVLITFFKLQKYVLSKGKIISLTGQYYEYNLKNFVDKIYLGVKIYEGLRSIILFA